MTTHFTDIRARLEAVAGVDWSETERMRDTELYSDWINVGPVHVPTTFSPGPEDRDWARQMESVAEFLQHAVEDIRRLLAEVDGR